MLYSTKSQVFVCIPSLKLLTCLETKFEAFAVCLPALSLVVVKHLSLSFSVRSSSTLGFFFGGSCNGDTPHSSSEDTSHRAKKQGSFIKRDGIGSKAIWATGVASSEEQV